jgi:hypothetical protein
LSNIANDLKIILGISAILLERSAGRFESERVFSGNYFLSVANITGMRTEIRWQKTKDRRWMVEDRGQRIEV